MVVKEAKLATLEKALLLTAECVSVWEATLLMRPNKVLWLLIVIATIAVKISSEDLSRSSYQAHPHGSVVLNMTKPT